MGCAPTTICRRFFSFPSDPMKSFRLTVQPSPDCEKEGWCCVRKLFVFLLSLLPSSSVKWQMSSAVWCKEWKKRKMENSLENFCTFHSKSVSTKTKLADWIAMRKGDFSSSQNGKKRTPTQMLVDEFSYRKTFHFSFVLQRKFSQHFFIIVVVIMWQHRKTLIFIIFLISWFTSILTLQLQPFSLWNTNTNTRTRGRSNNFPLFRSIKHFRASIHAHVRKLSWHFVAKETSLTSFVTLNAMHFLSLNARAKETEKKLFYLAFLKAWKLFLQFNDEAY